MNWLGSFLYYLRHSKTTSRYANPAHQSSWLLFIGYSVVVVNILFWLDFNFKFSFPLLKTRKPKLVATIRHLYRYLSCRAKGEIRTPLRKKNIYLVYQSALLWKGINKKNRLGAKIFFKGNCIQLKGQFHFGRFFEKVF